MLSRFVASAAKKATTLSWRQIHVASVLNAIEVKMPSLSPTMTEGTIVKWMKNEGESVSAGDVVCEIQTDKAVVALEVDDDGTLAKIIKPADSGTIQVGTLIAMLAEEDEDWKEINAKGAEESVTSKPADPTEETSKVSAAPSGGSTPGTEVNMPSLSPTMTEGTIVKWCKNEGDTISAGDVICEIQTDKAVVSMEWDDDAILAKIMVPEGTAGISVNSLIALTVEPGEDWKDVQIPAPQDSESVVAETKVDTITEVDKKSGDNAPEEVSDTHVTPIPKTGPAVMNLCAKYGIDPTKLNPTGRWGLIKSDVLKYIKEQGLTPLKITSKPKAKAEVVEQPKVVVEQTTAQPTISLGRPRSGYTDIPLTSMRAVIAKRLRESKSTSPHGYSTAECNIDSLNAIRNEFKSNGIKISVNDLVIKAAATALQLVPEVNLNTVGEDDYQIMPNIDISVAVATPNGLITPIVKDVVSKSLPDISNNVKDLALRARDGKLQLQEFQGGTFTISNLGMFGIKEFTAIINPPQCAIMAVGSGSIEINPETGKPFQAMRATLSFDRRFIDENTANIFMSTFQKVVEQPQYMNLGLVPSVRRANAMEL